MSGKTGWFRESYRHYLAGKGISTRKYAAQGTLLGSLFKYEDTVAGGATERFLKDVQKGQSKRLERLETQPVAEAQYREALLAQPITTRPLTIEERQLAQAVAQEKLGTLQQIKSASRAANLEFLKQRSERGLNIAKERSKLRIETAEQVGAKQYEAALKMKELESQRRAARVAAVTEPRVIQNPEVVVPPDWAELIARRQALTNDFLKEEYNRLIEERSAGIRNTQRESAIITATKRLAIQDFAEDLAKQKVRKSEAVWLETVRGQPGRGSAINPDVAVATYHGPNANELRSRVNNSVSKAQKELQKGIS